MFKMPLIAALLILAAGTSSAQRIKVKKDVIYLDKQASFQIVRTGGKGIAEAGSWAALSLGGDTLVRFAGTVLTIPKFDYETFPYKHNHYKITFAGTDQSTEFPLIGVGARRTLATTLLEGGVVENGQLNLEAVPAFCEEMKKYEKISKDYKGAAAFRKILRQDPSYPAYQKALKKRTVTDKLVISGGMFSGAVITMVDYLGKASVVGYIKAFNEPDGLNYYVTIGTKKEDWVAKLSYTNETRRLLVLSIFDKAEKEYFLEGTVDEAAVYEAVVYLMQHGYL